MSRPTLTWDCLQCGTTRTRPATRGQRPKWCSLRCADEAKAHRNSKTCEHCSAKVTWGSKFCSLTCANRHTAQEKRAKNPKPAEPTAEERAQAREAHRRSMCSPLRLAYEDNDLAALQEALAAETVKDHNTNCWIWQRGLRDGYPRLKVAGKALWRAIAEVVHGQLDGMPVHHICAVRACVNPDHLVPVTHAENAAEMLARNAYELRIAALESALRALDPNHPALNSSTVHNGTPI